MLWIIGSDLVKFSVGSEFVKFLPTLCSAQMYLTIKFKEENGVDLEECQPIMFWLCLGPLIFGCCFYCSSYSSKFTVHIEGLIQQNHS